MPPVENNTSFFRPFFAVLLPGFPPDAVKSDSVQKHDGIFNTPPHTTPTHQTELLTQKLRPRKVPHWRHSGRMGPPDSLHLPPPPPQFVCFYDPSPWPLSETLKWKAAILLRRCKNWFKKIEFFQSTVDFIIVIFLYGIWHLAVTFQPQYKPTESHNKSHSDCLDRYSAIKKMSPQQHTMRNSIFGPSFCNRSTIQRRLVIHSN